MATQVMLIRRAEKEFDCPENLLSSLVLSFLIACHHCLQGVYTFCQDKLCVFSTGKLCECGFFFSFFRYRYHKLQVTELCYSES